MSHRLPPLLLALPLFACDNTILVTEETPGGLGQEATPTPTAPLEGVLEVNPPSVDFGPVGAGCRLWRTVTVQNVGRSPVRVFGISTALEPDVFLADNRTGTLEFLDSWEVAVAYAPTGSRERSYGQLVVQSDDGSAPLRYVELLGSIWPGSERVDSFQQAAAQATDFLWVLDASSSMDEDIFRVLNSFEAFMSGLYSEGINYQMGFVTMDISKDEGQLKGTYGEERLPYLTREMGPDAIDDMMVTMGEEAGNNTDDSERGLDAISLALNETNLSGPHAGFIREGAELVIVVLSDDADYSSYRVDVYANQLQTLKGGPENVTFHAIIASAEAELTTEGGCADGVGQEYLYMTEVFGGVVDSICSADYDAILSTFGSYDKAILEDTFPLSATPAPDAGISVWVGDPDGRNMVEQPATRWHHDAVLNAIVFESVHLPPAGASIQARYTDSAACAE